MKRFLIIALVIFSLNLIAACNAGNTPEPEAKTIINIVESTVKDAYYIDEFNITTIKLNVTKGSETKEVYITPLMIENYPENFEVGNVSLKVIYEDTSTILTLNFIERETYTEGLEFALTSSFDSYKVVNYSGKEKNVIIPATFQYLPVTVVESYAFNNKQQIEKVSLPNTIKTIGANAFNGCTNLKYINIPNSVESIGNAAFYNCENLRSILLPQTIQAINEYAFYNVKLVYTNGSSISKWNEKAFNLNNVYIYYDLNLDNIHIYLDQFEYYEDESITILNAVNITESVVIPDFINNKKVTVIGDYACSNIEILSDVTIGSNVEIIGSYAFCETAIETIEIPSSVKELGIHSFSGCDALSNVIFNEGLEIIRRSVFSACMALQVVILPSTVTTIEDYGFQNCYNLKKVFIPKSVITMGENVFYQASKATLYIEAPELPSTWSKAFNPSRSKLSFNATKDMI